jgi:hypothetical protein
MTRKHDNEGHRVVGKNRTGNQDKVYINNAMMCISLLN